MDVPDLATLIARNPEHRVWAYVRVSSDKQVRDGEGLEAQQAAIEAYCKAKGLSAPLVVVEVASATKPMFRAKLKGKTAPQDEETSPRPLLLLLVGHLTDLPSSHIVMWKLDRLARDSFDQEMFLKLLWDSGVVIHSTDASELDTLTTTNKTDPQRVLLRQILGAFAQYEARVIEARMRNGLVHKAAKGGFTGGRPPYGYSVANGELQVSPYEAKWVRFIFAAKHQGWTLRATSTVIKARKDPSDDMLYHPSLLSRVLINEPMYRGDYIDVFGQFHRREDLRILPDDNLSLQQEFAAELLR
jgi:DNA invertase Pin-like site-specific DNA recombinase